MDQQITQLFDKMILEHKHINELTVFVVHDNLDVPETYKNIPVNKVWWMPQDRIMIMDKHSFENPQFI